MTGAIGAVRAWPRARVTRRLVAVAEHWPAALALLSGTVAFAWVALLLMRRTEGLAAPAYDLAFFQQIIWNVGQDGRWISSFHVGSFLGLHFSPLLLVPAALERIVGVDARVPNVIHAAAVGALAPATFLFIRAALRPARQAGPVAAGLALMVPITAAVQEIVRADFRPEAIGVVLAILAGWAGLTRRHRWMWALALVALTAREDVGYAVFAAALVVAARGRGVSRRHGLALAAIAIAWTAVVFVVLMPWFRDGAGAQTDSYYRWLGGGIGVLFAPFNRTDAVIQALTRPPAWFVVAGMIVAFAGLPLLRPTWLLLVVPPLAASLLSAHPPQHELVLQYALILVVPLTVASALGARRALTWATILRRRAGRRVGERRAPVPALRAAVPVALVVVLALPGAGVAFVQGSMPPFIERHLDQFGRASAMAELVAAAAAVPPEAALFVDEGLAAVLANRAEIQLLTGSTQVPPSALVLLERGAWIPNVLAGKRRDRRVDELLRSPRPVLVDTGRFVLLGPDPGQGS